MTRTQIEHWALHVIDRVGAKQPNEDSRVELKAEWPSDHRKIARQIAGLANAARGEPVLLLIGVNELKGVVGVDASINLADWRDQVGRRFDGYFPRVVDHIFSIDGKTIVALQFETDGAPFVVKTDGKDGVNYEVPWRELTGVRTANRANLLSLLVPQIHIPQATVTEGLFQVGEGMSADPSAKIVQKATCILTIYVSPFADRPTSFPTHLRRLEIRQKSKSEPVIVPSSQFRTLGEAGAVSADASGLTVRGAGHFSIQSQVNHQSVVLDLDQDAEICCIFPSAGDGEKKMVARAAFIAGRGLNRGHWRFVPAASG